MQFNPESPSSGLYLDVSSRDYHAAPGISKTGLDKIARSPRHYQSYLAGAGQDTDAMRIGRMVHAAVLEPDKFKSHYAVAPECNRSTNVGKAAWAAFAAENAGKELVAAKDHTMAEAMRDAVMEHPTGRNIIEFAGHCEASAWANDPDTGLLRKCRPDKLITSIGIVADLKTAKDASPSAFRRSCADLRYHVQAAYYLDTLALAGIHCDGFLLIAVEKTEPYCVGVYQFTEADFALGRELYQRNLRTLRTCMDTGIWPGYGDEIQQINLPAWAKAQATEGAVA